MLQVQAGAFPHGFRCCPVTLIVITREGLKMRGSLASLQIMKVVGGSVENSGGRPEWTQTKCASCRVAVGNMLGRRNSGLRGSKASPPVW